MENTDGYDQETLDKCNEMFPDYLDKLSEMFPDYEKQNDFNLDDENENVLKFAIDKFFNEVMIHMGIKNKEGN